MGDSRARDQDMDRRNPFRDLERMLEQLTEQFDVAADQWGEESLRPSTAGFSAMSVDVTDHGDEFTVTADVPGFEKDEIAVTLNERTLQITADRAAETDEETANYIRHERTRRSMSRSITLPDAVDEDGVSATYQNGVLTVTLPRLEPSRDGTQIDIE